MALMGVMTMRGLKDAAGDSEGRLYTAPKVGSVWHVLNIAASGTTSNAVDLGDYFQHLQVIIPSLTATTLAVHVSDTFGGTYQSLGDGVTTQSTDGGYSDTWILGGWRFVKIVAGTAQSAAVTIKARGITY
jgi:hypothetical protein